MNLGMCVLEVYSPTALSASTLFTCGSSGQLLTLGPSDLPLLHILPSPFPPSGGLYAGLSTPHPGQPP